VLLLGASWDAPNLALVMEYAGNGDVMDLLQLKGRRIKWKKRLKWIHEIVRAMCYLHNQRTPVMHRDLKMQNVLVTDYWVTKVSDFGESKRWSTATDDEPTNTIVGTPYYIAPEILRGENYDLSCDVFSFSILLALFAIRSGNLKELFSAEYREVVQKMMDEKRKARKAEVKEVKEVKEGGDVGDGEGKAKAKAKSEKKKISKPTVCKKETERIRGAAISNSHTKGWRTDLDQLGMPKEMTDLVQLCWHKNPKMRPTFNEISKITEEWTVDMFEESIEDDKSDDSRGSVYSRVSVM